MGQIKTLVYRIDVNRFCIRALRKSKLCVYSFLLLYISQPFFNKKKHPGFSGVLEEATE